MKRRQTRKPRVTLHKNGTMTISGLNYQDARSLVTAATLDLFRSEQKVEEEYTPDKPENLNWVRKMIWICQALDADILRCIEATHPPRRELSLKEQLLVNKQERELLERIVNETLASNEKLITED